MKALEILKNLEYGWTTCNKDKVYSSKYSKEDIDEVVRELEGMGTKANTKTCLWEPDNDGSRIYEDVVWISECNYEFMLNEGTPKENGFYYCPKCGKELIEIKED